FLLPIFLVFWAISFKRPAHVLWPLPGYLGLAVAMSGAAAEGAGAVARAYGRGRNLLVALCLLALVGAGFHLISFLPWLSPMQGPYGWKEVAERARVLKATLPESAFYLALGRKYTCTSEVAYHLKQPYDVHGENLIGYPALQYSFWSDPRSLQGREALVVIESRERAGLYEPVLRMFFDSVEPLGEVVVPVGRSTLRPTPPLTFHLFRARGYRPPATK
ncbi:MAG: hypothetical protein HY293_14215, partial [Planctomycetes bacterium]|nr:hypothetical protein [Planctomycetota bacterium]